METLSEKEAVNRKTLILGELYLIENYEDHVCLAHDQAHSQVFKFVLTWRENS